MKKKFSFTNYDLAVFSFVLTYGLGYITCQTHYTPNVPFAMSVGCYIMAIIWTIASIRWIFSLLKVIESAKDLIETQTAHIEIDQSLIDATQDLIVELKDYSPEEIKRLQDGLREVIARRKH